MTAATETPIEPRSMETVTRDRICEVAENRNLTKGERNEKIAGRLSAPDQDREIVSVRFTLFSHHFRS
jgi:hypothetical protein